MSVFNYQLTEWCLNDEDLKAHTKLLRKYETLYELREQSFGKTIMYAIFIEDPNHKNDYQDIVDEKN